jgi:hypothetical protein
LLAIPLCHIDRVARVNIAQVPEDGGSASGTVKVSVDNGAALLTGMGAIAIPSGIDPRTPGRCCHIAIGERSHLFDGSIDPGGGHA